MPKATSLARMGKHRSADLLYRRSPFGSPQNEKSTPFGVLRSVVRENLLRGGYLFQITCLYYSQLPAPRYAIYRFAVCELRNSVAVFVQPRVTTERKKHSIRSASFCGDPWENRTPVSALRGPCLSRLTNGPLFSRPIILP